MRQDGTFSDGTVPIRVAPNVWNRTAGTPDRDFRNDRFGPQPQLRVDRQRFSMEPDMTTTHRTPATRLDRAAFELLFVSLFDEGRGYAFPCDREGRVDLDAVGEALQVKPCVVSVMWANNEVGTIQPIGDVVAGQRLAAARRGAQPLRQRRQRPDVALHPDHRVALALQLQRPQAVAQLGSSGKGASSTLTSPPAR